MDLQAYDAAPTHIYYDVQSSNIQSTTTTPKPFAYAETRSQPILNNPSMYSMAIVRATLDTGTLPVFIPTIQYGTDPNLTIYSVTLDWTDPLTGILYSSGQVYVIWNPQSQGIPAPSGPSLNENGLQLNASGYYSCFSFSYWAALVYTALKTAHDNLVAASGGLYTGTHAPVLYYDTTSQCAAVYAELIHYNTQIANPVSLYFNAPLFELYGSLPAKVNNYESTIAGRNFRILFAPFGDVNSLTITPFDPVTGLPVPADAWVALIAYQEYPTLSALCPVTAIVITSSRLPIVPNAVSTPTNFSNAELGGTGASASNQLIITDFSSSSGLFKPNFVYSPTAQYRYISLVGNQPIYELDLQVYYRIKNGELIPFALNSGGVLSIKMLFEKKSLADISMPL